jgi:hypothetical protein
LSIHERTRPDVDRTASRHSHVAGCSIRRTKSINLWLHLTSILMVLAVANYSLIRLETKRMDFRTHLEDPDRHQRRR